MNEAVAGARHPALVELLRHDPRPNLRKVKVPVAPLITLTCTAFGAAAEVVE